MINCSKFIDLMMQNLKKKKRKNDKIMRGRSFFHPSTLPCQFIGTYRQIPGVTWSK